MLTCIFRFLSIINQKVDKKNENDVHSLVHIFHYYSFQLYIMLAV